MNHITKEQARAIPVDPAFTIYEYGTLGNGEANGTVAEVTGRYPAKGWGMNTVSDEIVYVISGSGKIEMPGSETILNPGDVAFVPKGQKIAWNGSDLKVFIPCVPAWTHTQHALFDE